MLTLYYVAATWLQSWRLSSTLTKIKAVRKANGSVVIHHELPPYIFMSPGVQQTLEVNSAVSKSCINYKAARIKDLLWYTLNKKMVSVFPRQGLDISGWILVIPGRTHLPIQLEGIKTSIHPTDKLYILVEFDYHTCRYQVQTSTLQIENYGTPIAWHAKEDNIGILLESDEQKLAALAVAFLQNDVTLENGIQIIRIQSVKTYGIPYKIYNIKTVPESYAPLDPDLDNVQRKSSFMERWRAHVSMLCTFCEAVEQVKSTRQEISVRHPGSGVGAVKLMPCQEDEQEYEEPSSVEVEVGDKSTSGYLEEEPGPLREDSPLPAPSEDGDGVESESVAASVSNATSTTTYIEPSTPSSLRSVSRMSTDTVPQEPTVLLSTATSMATSLSSSLRSLPTTPRRTITMIPEGPVKPPNIIVFSDSTSAAESVRSALEATLCKDRYTVHVLSCSEVLSEVWRGDAGLVVVHGNLPGALAPPLLSYLATKGASLLVLCSDLLGSILPVFSTAEVRPNELVHCSYKSWRHVPLMHHVFCYQPSAPSTHRSFSQDESSALGLIPSSVEVPDSTGQLHKLRIDVLGVEETWQTPSLLLASFTNSSAKIVFSQVHLETDPTQLECDETKRLALEKSDKARLEILCDVLSCHLGLQCSLKQAPVLYTPAYFLGNHEAKNELLTKLREEGNVDSNDCLKCDQLTLKLCGKGVAPQTASPSFLPLLLFSCPQSFSTVEYFENLSSEKLGRLVIYCQVLTSSMALVKGPVLTHGLAIIPQRQTQGLGRGGNSWLSPDGCAMFTLQLHVPLVSYLGQHLSFIQHLSGLAVVAAICEMPGLQQLDIGLKWPNDIYAHKHSKIGGIVVTSTITDRTAVVNIGCGLNLNNHQPTTCINAMINSLNKETGSNIHPLSQEKYFAKVFSKLEELYTLVQAGHSEDVTSMYYNFWLHSEAEVKVKEANGTTTQATIKGVDPFGFLLVATDRGPLTVQSDGNSFDMMAGLIAPKRS